MFPMSEGNSNKKVNKSSRKKRKEISPLSITGQQVCYTGGQSSDTQVHGNQFNTGTGVNSVNSVTQSVCSPNVMMNTPMNTRMMNMTSPIGNFSQPFYGYAPPPNQQMQQPQQSGAIPDWAVTLPDDVKYLKTSSDNFERTVQGIDRKVSAMETRLKMLETKVNDVESS